MGYGLGEGPRILISSILRWIVYELQDAHDWKESGADRLPLPEKAAKSRAIMARTNAAVVHENVWDSLDSGHMQPAGMRIKIVLSQ
jgi:hypothetical protein